MAKYRAKRRIKRESHCTATTVYLLIICWGKYTKKLKAADLEAVTLSSWWLSDSDYSWALLIADYSCHKKKQLWNCHAKFYCLGMLRYYYSLLSPLVWSCNMFVSVLKQQNWLNWVQKFYWEPASPSSFCAHSNSHHYSVWHFHNRLQGGTLAEICYAVWEDWWVWRLKRTHPDWERFAMNALARFALSLNIAVALQHSHSA